MKKKNNFFHLPIGLCLSLFSIVAQGNIFATENTAKTVMNLETAMNLAEGHAFSIRIASSSQEVSEGKANEALRSMLPNVSASGNYLHYDPSVNKAVGNSSAAALGIPGKKVSSASVTVVQPVVGLIPLFLNLRAASAQTEAALQNKEQTVAEARFNGANSFVNAVKALQLFHVAQSSVEVAKTQLHDGEAQFNAGKLTNADVLKFKLNLENAQTTLMQAETTYKITLVTLAEATGIPSTDDIALPQDYHSNWENNPVPNNNVQQIIGTALENRHDINAARSSVTAAKYAKSASISSYLPSVNLVANYSRNFEATDVSLGALDLKKKDIQDTLYYGVQFNWNILDWGVRQAQISEAVANQSAAEAQRDEAESNIKIDVTNSYLKLQDAYQTLDSAKVSVEYAKDVYKQMEAQFNNGQATTTDVLSAANDQASALAKLANATGDLDLAWLTLQKSTGENLTSFKK